MIFEQLLSQLEARGIQWAVYPNCRSPRGETNPFFGFLKEPDGLWDEIRKHHRDFLRLWEILSRAGRVPSAGLERLSPLWAFLHKYSAFLVCYRSGGIGIRFTRPVSNEVASEGARILDSCWQVVRGHRHMLAWQRLLHTETETVPSKTFFECAERMTRGEVAT